MYLILDTAISAEFWRRFYPENRQPKEPLPAIPPGEVYVGNNPFEVIELTAGQVGDLFAFEYIIQRIARLSGKRIRADKLGATPERLALRKSLFNRNQTQGRLCP